MKLSANVRLSVDVFANPETSFANGGDGDKRYRCRSRQGGLAVRCRGAMNQVPTSCWAYGDFSRSEWERRSGNERGGWLAAGREIEVEEEEEFSQSNNAVLHRDWRNGSWPPFGLHLTTAGTGDIRSEMSQGGIPFPSPRLKWKGSNKNNSYGDELDSKGAFLRGWRRWERRERRRRLGRPRKHGVLVLGSAFG